MCTRFGSNNLLEPPTLGTSVAEVRKAFVGEMREKVSSKICPPRVALISNGVRCYLTVIRQLTTSTRFLASISIFGH